MTRIKSKYTKEILEDAVKDCRSWRQTLEKLGLSKTGGGMYTFIQRLVKYHNVDVSHFSSKGWAKGKTVKTDKGVARSVRKRRYDETLIFIKNSTYQTSNLYNRLLEMGWENKCNVCGLFELWNDKLIRLHVHHIDGDNSNHVLNNLELICPNCHSQTNTYCGNKNGTVS